MWKLLTIIILIAVVILSGTQIYNKLNPVVPSLNQTIANSTPTPQASVSPIPIPPAKTIVNNYHIFQTFNNCGPASLSMALSYFGINKSQQELADQIRPYQVKNGDNDDKSVTLDELASKSQEFGLIAYHRPAGNIDLLKQFIAADIPVITRTWLTKDEDIGHYRVVKGYDETSLIQDDSYQNKNLKYSYADFNEIWKKFNYEYLVLVPQNKKTLAEKILAEDVDSKVAWKKAVTLSQNQIQEDPSDIYAKFNLSVAYYNIGEYQKSVDNFEAVENQLPFRTLWYQIEPILAYQKLGNYQKVFQITDKILNNQNRAFSELYLIRGQIYQEQGDKTAAKSEFEKAVLYNKSLKSAQEALRSV